MWRVREYVHVCGTLFQYAGNCCGVQAGYLVPAVGRTSFGEERYDTQSLHCKLRFGGLMESPVVTAISVTKAVLHHVPVPLGSWEGLLYT